MILLFCCFLSSKLSAQDSFNAIIRDSLTKEPIPGALATLEGSTIGTAADNNGRITLNPIPKGNQIFLFSALGYHNKKLSFSFPLPDTTPITIDLAPEELELIIVEGTRSNRSIANTPTRVEALTDEIEEAATMDPSKISHLLTHSTGIQVQQTSATSNTANVRIQGLDGRYTQILKDGFPLYGGFSGSLSITQIPPLDLRQVEYIKGSASTLYGGGAIAGLINLISKEPTREEAILHLNASQIGARDINAFVSRRQDNLGYTLLIQRNSHYAFDADNDGYSDMPALTKFNLNPRLFYYISDRTKLTLGGTVTYEQRDGGDMQLIGDAFPQPDHFYKEFNDINRYTTQLHFQHQLKGNSTLNLRNSFNIFERSLKITPAPTLEEYRFAGKQVSSFSEASWTHHNNDNVLITGLNFYTDRFQEDQLDSNLLRNEEYQTFGAFANYTFDLNRSIAIESGLRTDYVMNDKLFVLPRVSVLLWWTEKLTTRIGGGLGYRNPTIFNQEAELYGYQNILPIDRDKVAAEQSYGGNADIGFKSAIGEHIFLNLNQMFFYTHLDKPIVFAPATTMPGFFGYINANGHTRTYGAETFAKISYRDFTFFLGYTYTNATNHFDGSQSVVPLTPQHSIKGDLLYNLPGRWRIGADYEFKSAQTLSNGWETPSFWTFGALVEYTWKKLSIYGNVENFGDIRQTRWGSLRSGPWDTPQLTEVWAPLDGFVFNYGIRLKF